MEFRILGPLEVSEQGRSLPLGGAKQRALLAILLLHPNEVVSADRLIDGIWGERSPPTATKTLQVYVSQLRKRLGNELLVTRPPGYLLQVEDGARDLDRFEAHVKEAKGAEPYVVAAKLREALALWRGPPLADFAYDAFAQGEVERLAERRLAALEERLEADLALGLHADVVGELEALVDEHPFRERLRGQLMRALYRCGRQAEAIEVYEQARRALREELGIDPGKSLRDLHQAILRQDPSLDLVAEPVPAPEVPGGGFVGREAELAELVAGLENAFAGRGRLFLLGGEPGIGKSRLAEELVGHARARGARVLVGRCWEAGGAPAYWPWLQMLRSHVRETEPQALRTQLGVGAADVAQIVPELHALLPGLPEPLPSESEGARLRLFDSTAAFLRRAAARRPLVLVLDDLHAADEPSLLLLQFVARELADARVLVVAGYRDVDPPVGDPLAATLAELAREPVTCRLELAGLPDSDVAEFIAVMTGLSPDPAVVAEIQAQTEGNPLFVSEVTRLLEAEGALEEGAGRSPIGIPPGVREVIGRRLRRLSADCQRLLTLACVLGREFPLNALARISELPTNVLLELLDEAMLARVVGEVPGASGRLRFAHGLIRETLYEELTPARRLRLHAQTAELLELLYANRLDPHLAEIAHHFAEAAPAGDVGKAIAYARRAGDRAAELLAFEEAARLYRLALALTESDDDAAVRCELLVALGEVQARAGEMAAAKATFLQAAEMAGESGSGELLARAALGYGGRFVFGRGAEDDRVVQLLERAAAALGPGESPLRVRVLARLAGALRYQRSPEPRNSLSAQALAIARRLGDAATLAYALSGRLAATLGPDGLDERWSLASELAGAEDRERAFEGHVDRTIVLLARGDVAGIRREFAVQVRLADELGQPSQHWWIAAAGATLALLEGRLADAEQLIERARAVGERAESYGTLTYFQLQRFALRREQGRLDEVVTDLERAAERDPTRPLFRCALALAYEQLGRHEAARTLSCQLAVHGFGELPINNDWLLSAALLAELASSAREIDFADALYDRFAPYNGLNVDTVEVSTGSVSRYLGLLATTMGRFKQAERHFEDALAMNERMGARPWLAHSQRDYAGMLLERDQPGDRPKAQALVSQARVAYRELGMDSYAARASALVQEFAAQDSA